MADYTVSGAGSTAYNGDYTANGTQGDKTRYVHGNGLYAIGWESGEPWWAIYEITYGISQDRYNNYGSGPTPPLTGWNVGFSGTSPEPTLSVAAASDTIKPVFASAAVPVNGLSVAVTLTEADSPPILPASGIIGFSVTVDSVARAISSATASGNVVTLNLASVVFAGQAVTVSYSPGNVTDSASPPNAMLGFAAQSVANNSTDTPAVRLNFTSPAAGHEVVISRHRFLSGHLEAGATFPGQTGSTYLDTDVLPGYTYEYALTTRRISDGKTSYADAVRVTIPGTPADSYPAIPTALSAALE
jgi:hypothetical protein